MARIGRWAALSGVVGVVLMIGTILTGGNRPDSTAAGAGVQAYYAANHTTEEASVYLLAFAFIFILFFFGALLEYAREGGASLGVLGVMLVGLAVLIAGQMTGAGTGWALLDTTAKLSADGAQVLNVIGNDLVIASAVGFTVTMVAAGWTVARGIGLPKWLGWVAVVDGIGFVLPTGDFIPFIFFLLWILVVSGLLVRRAWREVPSNVVHEHAGQRVG